MHTSTVNFEVSAITTCAAGYQRAFRLGDKARSMYMPETHLAYMQHGGGGEYVVADRESSARVAPSFISAARIVAELISNGAAEVVVTYQNPATA